MDQMKFEIKNLIPEALEIPDFLWEDIGSTIVEFFPKLGTSFMILFVFWVASFIIQRIIAKVSLTNKVDPDLVQFMRIAGKWGVWMIGLAMALGTLGVDVTALVAGLGLTGFALGYALKDTISNSIAGIMVIAYKPFRRNDLIKVGAREHEGRVLGIDLRYTVLENKGDMIYIPNSLLFSNVVTVLDDDEEKEDLKLNQMNVNPLLDQ